MDASAFLESQDSWLYADQLGNSHGFALSPLQEFPTEELQSLQASAMDPSCSYRHTENAPALPFEEADDGLQSAGAASEEEALMMDSPWIAFLNEMLMDKSMDERVLAHQDYVSYQSIVDSLNKIVDETPAGGCHGDLRDVLSTSSPTGGGLLTIDSLRKAVAESSTSDHHWDLDSMLSGLSVPFPASVSSIELSSDSNLSPGVISIAATDVCDQQEEPGYLLSSYTDGFQPKEMFLTSNNNPHRSAVANGLPVDKLLAAESQNVGSDSSEVESSDKYISFVKNRDLNVEGDYASLYLSQSKIAITEKAVNHQSNEPAVETRRNRHASNKRSRAGLKEGKKKNAEGAPVDMIDKNVFEAGLALDLKELLVSCAQAVAVGNASRAFETLQQLRRNGASANGNGLHRVIYYFSEALEARICGTGKSAYLDAASNNRPSVAKLLIAFKSMSSFLPTTKLGHYFANLSILKAAEGATRLHIIDYGIFYGLQWPCLINALADRKEGPPRLVITGIDFPQPGDNPKEGLEDIGNRLSEYAKAYNVPFEYHAIAASQWEDVNPALCATNDGQEVLVVNCMHRLRHVLDESIVSSEDTATSCPRQKLLENMCKLSPDLFVVAVVNASHSSPFFVPRFREALNYYSSKFDMLESTWDSGSERMILERDCFYRDILNIVACEGFERVERPENYKQWQARIQRAGFEQLPIVPSVFARSRAHVQSYYHKDFSVDHDSNRWMLVSWKGRTTSAMSAWRPSGIQNRH